MIQMPDKTQRWCFDTEDFSHDLEEITMTTATKTAPATIPGYTTLTNHLGQALYLDTPTYTLIHSLLDQGGNLFLFGPAGVAKTELAQAILQERGLAVYQIETGAVTSGDELDGYKTLDPAGGIAVIPSPLLLAVKSAASGTPTGLVADELNRVQAAGAVNKLLPLFSGQRIYNTDLEGALSVGDKLQTIATANVGYRGTVRLNEALLDRFDPIGIKPLSGKVLETMLAQRFPSLAIGDIRQIVSLSDSILKMSENDPDGDLKPLSTRDAQRICRGLVAGLSPVDAITTLVGGQLEIRELGKESVDALVAQAKGKFK